MFLFGNLVIFVYVILILGMPYYELRWSRWSSPHLHRRNLEIISEANNKTKHEKSVSIAKYHSSPWILPTKLNTLPAAVQRKNIASSDNTSSLPYCGHSLVISGPRHGSTWFLNNIENCTYSQPDGTFGTLHDESELWIPRPNSKVLNITISEAEHYIIHNVSLKMFPWPWRTYQNNSRRLLHHCKRHKIPIILLQRDPLQAFRSMIIAEVTNNWNKNTIQNYQYKEDHTDHFERLIKKHMEGREKDWKKFHFHIKQHVASVHAYLDLHKLPHDLVSYEKLINLKIIYLPNAGCKIQNCNFIA